MTITGAIVLFAVIWFMVLYILLPQGVRTQNDEGEIAPGTPGSAPVEPKLRRKIIWTTGITAVLWALVVGIILSGWIDIRDLDFYGRPDIS